MSDIESPLSPDIIKQVLGAAGEITLSGEELAALQVALARIQQENERLQKAAYVDSGTGIPNRRLFEETALTLLEKARDNPSPSDVTLLVLADVDNLKWVNDELGHSKGDDVLQSVANALIGYFIKEVSGLIRASSSARASDFISAFEGGIAARCGGDEFGVLLNGIPREKAQESFDSFAKRVRQINNLEYTIDGQKRFFHVTISLGYGLLEADRSLSLEDNYKEVYNQADFMAIRDKELKPQRIKEAQQFYSPEQNNPVVPPLIRNRVVNNAYHR